MMQDSVLVKKIIEYLMNIVMFILTIIEILKTLNNNELTNDIDEINLQIERQ